MSEINTTGTRAKVLEGAYTLESPGELFGEAVKAAQKRGEKPVWTSARNTADAVASFSRTIGEFPITVAIEGSGLARIDITLESGGRKVDLTEFTADQLKAATQGLPDWVKPRVDKAIAALPKRTIAASVGAVVDHVVKQPGTFSKWLGKTEPAAPIVDAALQEEAKRREKVITTFETARKTLENIEGKLPADDTHAQYLDTSRIIRRTLGQAIRATGDDQAFTQAMRLGVVAPIERVANEIAGLLAKGDFAGNIKVIDGFERRLREINDPIVDRLQVGTRAGVAGVMVGVAGANTKDAVEAAEGSSLGTRVRVSGQTVTSLRAEKRATPATTYDLDHIFNDNSGARSVASFLTLARDVLVWGDTPQPYAVFPKPANPDAAPFGPANLYIWQGGFAIRDGVKYDEVSDAALSAGGVPATTDSITASLESAAAQIEDGLRNYYRERAPNIDALSRSDLFFAVDADLKRGMTVDERTAFHKCLADVGFDMPIGFDPGAQTIDAATHSQAVATAAAATTGALAALETMFQTKGSSAHAVGTFLAGAGAFMEWAQPQPYAIFGNENEGPANLFIWKEGFAWKDAEGAFRPATEDDLANYGVTAEQVEASLDAAAEKVEAGLRTYFRGEGINTDRLNRTKLVDGLNSEAWKATDEQRQKLATAMAEADLPIA